MKKLLFQIMFFLPFDQLGSHVLVYIDDLLVKLKRNGIGCHIGHKFLGILGYGDDIILLCPSVASLKKMIKICEDYAEEHNFV